MPPVIKCFKLDPRTHRTRITEVLQWPVPDDNSELLGDEVVEAVVSHTCMDSAGYFIYGR